MTISPLVSIVVPVYNGADYLAAAIESALAQTYRRTEVIVVNDGSRDDEKTERIAKSFGSAIRYLKKPNGGVASALNYGISQMAGEYFSWLSHDDLYLPHKIETQLNFLRVRSGNIIVYCDYEVFSNTGTVSNIRMNPPEPRAFRRFITLNNSLHGCTLLIPRRAFDMAGLFDESLRTTQDYDLWFRMADYFEFAHIPQILVRARSHAGQGSHKLRSVALMEINALLKGFVRKLSDAEIRGFTNAHLSSAYSGIARSMAQRGFLSSSRYAASLAFRHAKHGPWQQMCGAIAALFYSSVVGPAWLMLRQLKHLLITRLRK